MRTVVVLVALLGLAAAAVVPRPLDDVEEDSNLNTMQLLTKYGYPAEEYQVQTADGYLLTLHRVPYGLKCGPERSRGPVLLQHGLLSSSADWVVTGTEGGLAYILADHCYDVWMPNSRGNTYSRAHISLSPKDSAFWNFSWHEMGLYDLPASIQKILHETNRTSLVYAGHSQGTTQFWVYASTYPEEAAQKVRGMFALAPVALLDDTQSKLLSTIAKFNGVIEWVANMLGIDEFLPSTQLVADAGGILCSDSHPDLQGICTNVLFIIAGYDSEELNATILPVILAHTPAGAATKQLLHYSQSMNSGIFRQYDYGKSGNKDHYGQAEPPEYDLSKIQVPIAFLYSRNDNFAALPDVEELFTKIGGPKIGKFLVQHDAFNHLDYLWAIHAKSLVYDKMMSLMDRY